MTKEQTESAEHALRTLSDIKSLRQSDAFGRYWMTRLNQKRDALNKRYLDEPANESTRQIIAAYDGLLKMMAEDENAAQATLTTLQRSLPPGQNPVVCAS